MFCNVLNKTWYVMLLKWTSLLLYRRFIKVAGLIPSQIKILLQSEKDLLCVANGPRFFWIIVWFGSMLSRVNIGTNGLLGHYVIVHHLQSINTFWACVHVLLNLFVFNKSFLKPRTLYQSHCVNRMLFIIKNYLLNFICHQERQTQI